MSTNDMIDDQLVADLWKINWVNEKIVGEPRAATELRGRLKRLREAALAYQELATCYRIGKQPSEKLHKRLKKAAAALRGGG